MRIEVFSPCYNEERLLPLFLEWYDFADQITLMDGGSDDRTKEIALANPRVRFDESRGFHTDNLDARVVTVMNTCWIASKADWVIVCAVDEFLYHPIGLGRALATARDVGTTIPPVQGFEMACDEFPADFSQLPKCGTRNPAHDKRLVFNPQKVAPNYGPGCHTCNPTGEVNPGAIVFAHLHMRFLGYDHFVARNMGLTKFSGTGCDAWTEEKSRQQWMQYSQSVQPVISSLPTRKSEMTLSQLFDHHGSDKAHRNGYGKFYEDMLNPRRESIKSMLEIGVFKGDSMRAWEDFFPNADIIGVDDGSGPGSGDGLVCSNGGRRKAFRANAADASSINQVLGNRTFDLIVDDGSHIMQDQLIAREILWPRLNPGGLYVVEDLLTQEVADRLFAAGGGKVYIGNAELPGAAMIVQEKPAVSASVAA